MFAFHQNGVSELRSEPKHETVRVLANDELDHVAGGNAFAYAILQRVMQLSSGRGSSGEW